MVLDEKKFKNVCACSIKAGKPALSVRHRFQLSTKLTFEFQKVVIQVKNGHLPLRPRTKSVADFSLFLFRRIKQFKLFLDNPTLKLLVFYAYFVLL